MTVSSNNHHHEFSLLVQSKLLSMFHNLNSSHRPESLEKRQEGWTEVWGKSNKENVENGEPTTLVLVQFRPAWLEQLALNIAGIPHVVMNSPYMTMESTGPLPCLMDVSSSGSSSLAMVGRNHPKSTLKHKSCILDYLETQLELDLDSEVASSKELRDKALLYKNIITTQLDPVLDSLTYLNDDTWQSVYRKQCFRASRGNYGGSCWLLGPIQAASQVVMAKLAASRQYKGKDEALAVAKQCYDVFEHTLSSNDDEPLHLLNTPAPTLVDVMLWSHLADALGNVHLLPLLVRDYPNLVAFLERTRQKYFVVGDNERDWKTHNLRENGRNAFYPFQENNKEALPKSLQQQVLQQPDESIQNDYSSAFFKTWNTWRMGGRIIPETEQESKEQEQKQPMDKLKKLHKKHDEQWMSVVIGAAILAIAMVLNQKQ